MNLYVVRESYEETPHGVYQAKDVESVAKKIANEYNTDVALVERDYFELTDGGKYLCDYVWITKV